MTAPAARRVRGGADDGFAALVVLALAAVLVLLSAVGLAVASVAVVRHRAASTADLAALSAAVHAREGEGPACDAARRVVVSARARLLQCRVEGFDVVVVVAVAPPAGLSGLGEGTAGARAGPDSSAVGR